MKWIGLICLVAASLMLGSAAFANWNTPSTGTGSGTTGTTVGVTLTPGSVTGTLFPGGAADVSTVATNPNRAPVRLLSLALDTTQGTGGFTVDAAHAGCTTTSFTFTTRNHNGKGWTVQESSRSTLTLQDAVAMSASAPSACQGATVTVYLRTVT